MLFPTSTSYNVLLPSLCSTSQFARWLRGWILQIHQTLMLCKNTFWKKMTKHQLADCILVQFYCCTKTTYSLIVHNQDKGRHIRSRKWLKNVLLIVWDRYCHKTCSGFSPHGYFYNFLAFKLLICVSPQYFHMVYSTMHAWALTKHSVILRVKKCPQFYH